MELLLTSMALSPILKKEVYKGKPDREFAHHRCAYIKKENFLQNTKPRTLVLSNGVLCFVPLQSSRLCR